METDRMEKTLVAIGIICIVFALLLSINGCAHVSHKITSPPIEQIKVDLGKMGVVSAQFQPEAKFRKPIGKGASAGIGAGVGAAGGAALPALVVGAAAVATGPVGIVLLAYPPITAAVVGAVAVGAAAGAVGGGIAGAVKGNSSKKIKGAETVLNSAFAEINIQETVRKHFLLLAQETTSLAFISLEEQSPNVLDEKVIYDSFGEEGIDTILEISVRKYGLWGERGINPPLHFFMTVSAKLIRVKDAKELYSHTFRYESGQKKFVSWAVDNGQPFREELDRSCRTLAQNILDKIISLDSSQKLCQTSVVDQSREHMKEIQISTEISEEVQNED